MARHAGRRRRGPRLRAALAGGIVLGVGAVTTLAAWTDDEVARGSFQAGTFQLQGATNGTAFTSTTAAAPATLTLGPGSAGAMVPNQSVYALYSVRTAPGSVAGTVTVPAPAVTGSNSGVFRQAVRVVPGTTCDAATFDASSTTVIPPGSALTVGQTGTLPLAANAGGAQNLCLRLTLPADVPNSAQGATAQVTWTFQGVSVTG